jgi:hypothetical protein
MIPPTIEIVSYTSIICMILVYDTFHYNQPYNLGPFACLNRNQASSCGFLIRPNEKQILPKAEIVV